MNFVADVSSLPVTYRSPAGGPEYKCSRDRSYSSRRTAELVLAIVSSLCYSDAFHSPGWRRVARIHFPEGHVAHAFWIIGDVRKGTHSPINRRIIQPVLTPLATLTITVHFDIHFQILSNIIGIWQRRWNFKFNFCSDEILFFYFFIFFELSLSPQISRVHFNSSVSVRILLAS